MDAPISTTLDDDAFGRLESLDAIRAIRAWLEDDYGYGEDRVLMQAIRRGAGVTLEDRAMWTVLSAAHAAGDSAASTLAELVALEAATAASSPRPR